MKAIDILEWIVKESINGEFINFVDVPEEGDYEWQQNEEWWVNMFGACPPCPQDVGKYLYYYASCDLPEPQDEPDFQIEVPNSDNLYGYDYINFYKIEE